MVSEDIKGYTKEAPYRLTWRFDLDETLESVLTINGDGYRYNNETNREEYVGFDEEERERLTEEYSYLKDTEAFTGFMKQWLGYKAEDIKVLNDGSSYIDYVNEGWPNADGRTFSLRTYWQTEKGTTLLDWEENDVPLSKDGLFIFDDTNLPCRTRTFENGECCYDFRADPNTQEQDLEDDIEI